MQLLKLMQPGFSVVLGLTVFLIYETLLLEQMEKWQLFASIRLMKCKYFTNLHSTQQAKVSQV